MAYRIEGVDRETGADVESVEVEATSEREALDYANHHGIVVSKLTPIGDGNYAPHYSIRRGRKSPAIPAALKPDHFMGNDAVSLVLTAAGIVGGCYALFMSQSAPGSDVLNLGLLNDRLVVAVLSSAVFLAGVMGFAATQVCRQIRGRAEH